MSRQAAINIINRKLKERQEALAEQVKQDATRWRIECNKENARATKLATQFLKDSGFSLSGNVSVNLTNCPWNHKESDAIRKARKNLQLLSERALALKDEISLQGIDPSIMEKINALFGQ